MPSTWDVEKDIAPADSVPEIRNAASVKDISVDGQWVYRLSKDGQYVIRMLKSVYLARGKWSINKHQQWDSDKKVKRAEREE